MYRPIILILLVVTIFSFSSCITSLHQLVTYDKVINDNRVRGTWQQDNKSIFTIEDVLKSEFFKRITKATVGKEEMYLGFDNKEDSLLYSKSYFMSYTKSGYTYHMMVSLVQLNNEIYADISPLAAQIDDTSKSKETVDLVFDLPYMPTHTIAKITFANSSMTIKFLNGDFIKNQLAEGSMAVKYESDPLFNTALITASSAELQQFIIKYGNDERLYSNENTITVKKI